MADEDILHNVKNHFYLGNLKQAVIEAKSVDPPTSFSKEQRSFYLLRTYLDVENTQGMLELVEEAKASPNSKFAQFLKFFLAYLNKEVTGEKLETVCQEFITNPDFNKHPLVMLMVGLILYTENNISKAVLAVKDQSNLEMQALKLVMMVKNNRVNLAEKQLDLMKQTDEEATITQIAIAWVQLLTADYETAYHNFHELSERFSSTINLFNLMALCMTQLERYEDAEGLLQEALTLSNENYGKDDATTLINLLVVTFHLDKPQTEIDSLMGRLQQVDAHSEFLQKFVSGCEAFDNAAANYSV